MADKTPRVLLYDIENTPSLGYVWDKWQTNVVEFKEDWYLLCFAYKWLGDRSIQTVSLPDFQHTYKRDKTDDYGVAAALWDLFDEADIVVAHNGNRFDQSKARARFLVHGFDPPSPFKEIDTLQIARRQFNFTSSSLDDLCRQLGFGRKAYDGGFATWLGCMDGDPAAWSRMLRYNRRDVQMLEKLYLRLRPWTTAQQHPNVALLADKPNACPKCGHHSLESHGWKYANVTKRRQFRCRKCGGFCSGRKVEKSPVTHVN